MRFLLVGERGAYNPWMSPLDVVLLVVVGLALLPIGYVAVFDLRVRRDWKRHPLRFTCDKHPAGYVCYECSPTRILAEVDTRRL
jgi:hypothetical protein